MKSKPTYARFVKEVLALYEPPLRRKSTYFKMRTVLEEFRALKLRTAADITPAAILRWLKEHADRSPWTNRSYLSSLRAACNLARKMKLVETTPWDVRTDWVAIDLDEEDEPEQGRHLTVDEIVALLARADVEAAGGGWAQLRLQALVYTYVYTGQRTAEALGMKTKDVHLDKDLIKLRSRRKRKLKTRSSNRPLGIPEDLKPVLARWIPLTGCEWLFPGVRKEGPWLTGGPGRKPLEAVQALAERAGLGHITIQQLRRSLATAMKGMGFGPLEVRDQLGHGVLETQEWYLEESAEAARDVARRIRFRRPGPEPLGPNPPRPTP